jgi:hypothetical protein
MFEFMIDKDRVSDFCRFVVGDIDMSDFITMQSHKTFTLKMQIDWFFKEEIQNWLEDQHIKCEILSYEETSYSFPKCFSFERESDAVLFKLTWL